MKRTCCCLALAICALAVPLLGQAPDVTKVVADARAALGGEKKLGALQTLTATGQSVRVTPDGSQAPTDWEMAFELPDKFVKKEVLTTMGNSAVTRTSGFNAETPIDAIDQPPAMPGMIRIVRSFGPGGDPNAPPTPEQQAENRKKAVTASKQDFSRLLLGLIVAQSPAYPLQLSSGGQAESPDGKADIIDVRGEGDFAARLFIDGKTHLPLMLSWMAREPLVITRSVGGAPKPAAGGGNAVFQAPAHGGQPPTPEERDKMVKQMQDQATEAAAKLRVVEYRLYYGDYRDVDGVKVPYRLQRSIDGKPSEEITLEKVKINGKVDPKKFEGK